MHCPDTAARRRNQACRCTTGTHGTKMTGTGRPCPSRWSRIHLVPLVRVVVEAVAVLAEGMVEGGAAVELVAAVAREAKVEEASRVAVVVAVVAEGAAAGPTSF